MFDQESEFLFVNFENIQRPKKWNKWQTNKFNGQQYENKNKSPKQLTKLEDSPVIAADEEPEIPYVYIFSIAILDESYFLTAWIHLSYVNI